MKHRLLSTLLLLSALLLSVGCADEEQYADNPRGNFEALWHIMDEHYCFFAEKQATLGVDWTEVYSRYSQRVHEGMTEGQLFEVLAAMLGELRDGHVNLYSAWDVGRNWSWHEDYPNNLDENILDSYLGTDYRIAAGMSYRILDDNIGYLRCVSFADGMGEGNLDEVMFWLAPCRALIVDVRGNGGGQLTAAQQLAARFTNETLTVGYMCHKTGKGHADFSALERQVLAPSAGIRWQKPVAVLTNRSVFSAANEFVKYMHCCPQAIVVGDHTGGGAGLPYVSELPCGWAVRFSACPMYDADKRSTEDGIAPDYPAEMQPADALLGKDTIIETARRLLAE